MVRDHLLFCTCASMPFTKCGLSLEWVNFETVTVTWGCLRVN